MEPTNSGQTAFKYPGVKGPPRPRLEFRFAGLWMSATGAKVTTAELLRAQGMPPRFFSPEECQVSPSAFGAMIGNSIPPNLTMRVLPRALHSAGLLPQCQTTDFWEHAVAMFLRLGLAEARP